METNVSLYVVKNSNGSYFAGFDPAKGEPNFVNNPIKGKIFSNKNTIKLRPEETIVELTIDLSSVPVKISEPFRPQRKIK